MQTSNKERQYYSVLELQPGASIDQLKEARRVLTKVWHPDRFIGDAKMQKKATEKLAAINEAYQALMSILSRSSAYESSSHSRTPAYRPTTGSYAEPEFVTDLKNGETVEIVELHTQDDYYSERHKLAGKIIKVKNPVHIGNGCTHATFQSTRKGILFGQVRVKRIDVIK